MMVLLFVSMWWLEEEISFGNLIVGFLGVNNVNDNINIWTGLIVYYTWWGYTQELDKNPSPLLPPPPYSCGLDAEVRKLWLREDFEGLWEHPFSV